MPLGAEETQAIVEQLLPLLSQGTTLSDLIAGALPQIGTIGAVAYAAMRRVRALEEAIFATQKALDGLVEQHNPTVVLLEDLAEANGHQHTFNTWAGNAIEFLVEQVGAVCTALAKHGVDVVFNEARATLLKLSRPTEGK